MTSLRTLMTTLHFLVTSLFAGRAVPKVTVVFNPGGVMAVALNLAGLSAPGIRVPLLNFIYLNFTG